MFIMYDSVDLSQIPRQPHAVLSYVDGRYANHAEALHLFPHARHLPMSTGSGVVCRGYDVEKWDYTPEDVPRLLDQNRLHGIEDTVLYASLSVWPQIREIAQRHGHADDTYQAIYADYDGKLEILPGYVAHQLTDRALGRNLDMSICQPNLFPAAPAEPHWDRAQVAKSDHGVWVVEPLPARVGPHAF